MATTATIHLNCIESVQIYVNKGRKTLAQIKAETGADYICNGGFYDMAKWQAVMHLRVDGENLSNDQYSYWGYGWTVKDIRSMRSDDKFNVRNYICGVEIIRDGIPLPLMYDKSIGGARGRTAIGLTKSGALILYCIGDGQAGRLTPEELRSEMLALGAESAIMLDGGASSQCDFSGNVIQSPRIVHNYICVKLNKEVNKSVDLSENSTKSEVKPSMYHVFIDPGHGGTDNSNQSPDGKYKEHIFSLDLAQRIQKLLQDRGIRCTLTRNTDASVSLLQRAALANSAKANLFLSVHTNASAGSGWTNASGLVVYTYAAGGTRDVLANHILRHMRESDVGIFGQALYHAGFTVLAQTSMPACLVEYGFHTNRADVALLQTDSHKDKLAIATAKGICDTLGVAWEERKIYTVQLGAFGSKAAAQAVVDKLKEIGVNAEIKEG